VIARPLSQVATAVGGQLRGGDAVVSSVVTDSRQARTGSLFVALRGDHADGHDFVQDALANGATGTLADRPVEGTAIAVADTGRALL